MCFAVFCKTGSSASAQAVANNSCSIEMSLDALRALQELESVISGLLSQQNNYFPSTSSAADGMTNVGSTYNPIGDTGGAVSSGHAVAAVSNYEVAGGMNDVAGGQMNLKTTLMVEMKTIMTMMKMRTVIWMIGINEDML